MDLYPQDRLRAMGRRGILRTPRLVLRPYAGGDAAPLAAAIGTYDVARWLGRVPYPYRVDDARDFIAKVAGRVGRDWAIERNGTLIGGISVDHELGYWFTRTAWGQGLATEACDAAVDAFFADRGAKVLTSSHMADNARSSAVLAKQGFRYTGDACVVPSAALSQSLPSRAMVLDRATWIARRRYRLSSPGLTLRELWPADLSAIRRLARLPDTGHVFGSGASDWSEGAAGDWLQRCSYRGRLGFALALCRWRRVVGVIAVRADAKAGATCDIAMDPTHRARGDGALAAVLADARARFALSSVSVGASPP